MTPQTPISEVLSVRACAAVERALASATDTAHDGPTVVADATILTESQLRAVTGPKVVREVRAALRDAGLTLASDPDQDIVDSASPGAWDVLAVVTTAGGYSVKLGNGGMRTTIPCPSPPKVRVGDRVWVELRRVRRG